MIKAKSLLLALIIPVLALALMTGYHTFKKDESAEFTFPIEGYDPRDLLAGHYLQFKINFDVSETCIGRSTDTTYLCLETKKLTRNSEACEFYVKGFCQNNKFEIGPQRYYVPADRAAGLETLIRQKSAKVIVGVPNDGHVYIKKLLIDDQPWK